MQTHNLLPPPARTAVACLLMCFAIAATSSRAAEPLENHASSVRPASAPTLQQRIDALIERLGDDDYHVRRDAQRRLARLGSEGFETFDALSAAAGNADPEVAARARYLLRLMQVNFADKSDPPQVQGILSAYLSKSTDEKIQRLRALAALQEGEGLSALCRLVRFQRNELLSKHAAIAILAWQEKNPAAIAEKAPIIQQQLGQSQRTAARWLRESLRFVPAADDALEQWNGIVRRESDLLARDDGQTDPHVVGGLIRHELHWIFALHRSDDEKVASLERMVSLHRKDCKPLTCLLPWLVEAQAWKPLGLKPDVFAERFAFNPRKSLYALAEALVRQDKSSEPKSEKAERAAELAFRLDPGGEPRRQQAARLAMAHLLIEQRRYDWAEREYRYCLQKGGKGNKILSSVGLNLSEVLHDQGKDLRGAKVLGPLLEGLQHQKQTDDNDPGNIKTWDAALKRIEVRRCYLLSEHYKLQGDLQQQRQQLERALAVDPSDVEVLIACYHLKDLSPQFRDKIRKHIRQTVDRTRIMALKHPGLPVYYNQLAWLVSNTEGDLDEALRFSQKSLKLQHNCGGYYDTLARCYFARGELKKAIDAQTRAARLEPNSGLIAKQLQLFKQKLAQKTRNKK